MKHIIGMAKRFLDLEGARAPKLELDYLRLVYAVKELRKQGIDAQGYLLVFTKGILSRTALWQEKYNADGTVIVSVAPITTAERQAVEREIEANKNGMLAGTRGEETNGLSSAEAGGGLGEHYLKLIIEANEPGVVREYNERAFPLRIRWDYFGKK